MSWSAALSVIGKLAPTIASAVGGPLAGSAVSALEGALGVNATGSLDKKQDTIAAAIAGATPEQLLALKQADNDFAVKMQTLGFENAEALEKLAADDRDSARKREISVKDWTPRVLALAVTVGFFGILAFLLFRPAPEASRDILNIMLGSLGAAFTGIIAYFYGSSSGSAEKTTLLAKAPAVKD